MNDFDYDCMQKKRIAMGAFAHINRKRGGCSLPSDTLTEKQRKEKNGEVKSYNITRPMPWYEFKAMPEDLKREFSRNMQSFGGTAKWLAEKMGASDQTIRAYAERVGAPFRRGAACSNFGGLGHCVCHREQQTKAGAYGADAGGDATSQ